MFLQIPQLILNDCHERGKPCRIFCTQPRRLSAVSVAERVAAERGEKIGQTVGYQIRLESRTSPKTLLTFCTNGVLLRTLMGGDASVSTVTHILVVRHHIPTFSPHSQTLRNLGTTFFAG